MYKAKNTTDVKKKSDEVNDCKMLTMQMMIAVMLLFLLLLLMTMKANTMIHCLSILENKTGYICPCDHGDDCQNMTSDAV